MTKTKEGCPLEYDVVDLKMRDRRSGEVVPVAQMRDMERDLCAARGATMEGSSKARDTAAKAVMDFLNKTFKS